MMIDDTLDDDGGGGVPDAEGEAEEGDKQKLGEERAKSPSRAEPGERLRVDLVLPLVEHFLVFFYISFLFHLLLLPLVEHEDHGPLLGA